MKRIGLVAFSLLALAGFTGCGGVEQPQADSLATVEQSLDCSTGPETFSSTFCTEGYATKLPNAPCGVNGWGYTCTSHFYGGCAAWQCSNIGGTPTQSYSPCSTWLPAHGC